MGAAGCPHLRCWRCSSSSALGCNVSGRGCGAPNSIENQHQHALWNTMRTAHRISTNTPCGNNENSPQNQHQHTLWKQPTESAPTHPVETAHRISTNTPCGNSPQNQHQHTLWKQPTESAPTHPVETAHRISTNTPCGNSPQNQHQHTLWKQCDYFNRQLAGDFKNNNNLCPS